MQKAVMKSSSLEKKSLKKNQQIFKNLQKAKKNYCGRPYKTERNKFFNNLNLSFVTDNKLFWKKIKTFFSNKNDHGTNIKLVAGDKS